MSVNNENNNADSNTPKIPDDWESIEEIRVVHPDYGFINENSDFAKQCSSAGLKVSGNTKETNFEKDQDIVTKDSFKMETSFNPLDGRPIRLLRRPESSSKLKEKSTDEIQKMTKSLTLEEREAAYQEARNRIFGTVNNDESTSNYSIVKESSASIVSIVDDSACATTVNTTKSTLWMGDLKPDWDAEFIKEAFRHLSFEIRNIKMVPDRFGTKSTYCFVEFADAELARNAMLTCCGQIVPNTRDGSKFILSFANGPNQCPEYNLFVSNLSATVDDVTLFRTFGERYASCRGAKIYRNPDGSSREIGVVRFMNETDQQNALTEMNKFRLHNKEIALKLAQPKDRHRVYVPRLSYDRINGRCQRYANNAVPSAIQSAQPPPPPPPPMHFTQSVIPMPNFGCLPQNSSMLPQPFLNANPGVAAYGLTQPTGLIPRQYGAPPPFLMQYSALVPPNTNMQQQSRNVEETQWQTH